MRSPMTTAGISVVALGTFRHDRAVRDPEPGHPVHPASVVDDGTDVVGGPHLARSDRMPVIVVPPPTTTYRDSIPFAMTFLSG